MGWQQGLGLAVTDWDGLCLHDRRLLSVCLLPCLWQLIHCYSDISLDLQCNIAMHSLEIIFKTGVFCRAKTSIFVYDLYCFRSSIHCNLMTRIKNHSYQKIEIAKANQERMKNKTTREDNTLAVNSGTTLTLHPTSQPHSLSAHISRQSLRASTCFLLSLTADFAPPSDQ